MLYLLSCVVLSQQQARTKTVKYIRLDPSLLCSKNCLLCICFLALLQFCAYYARFYATPQSIMLVVLHSLIQNLVGLSLRPAS